MNEPCAYTKQRIKRLPEMVEATERKLAGLYREAKRYGMDEILESKLHFDAAWEREILIAKIEAAYLGNETTMAGGGI